MTPLEVGTMICVDYSDIEVLGQYIHIYWPNWPVVIASEGRSAGFYSWNIPTVFKGFLWAEQYGRQWLEDHRPAMKYRFLEL